MRTLLTVATRVLGTRYGIALLLGVLVLATVGAAQLLGTRGGTDGGLRSGGQAGVTLNPTAGDDGEVTPGPVDEPVTSPGAPVPEAVAGSFAAAWVDHRGASPDTWLDRLKPYATAELEQRLAGVDPVGVPADRVTGAVRLIPRGESIVEVAVPVDSGLLRLRLVATAGRWLVDGVDWERA